jgi:hypothetical protein
MLIINAIIYLTNADRSISIKCLRMGFKVIPLQPVLYVLLYFRNNDDHAVDFCKPA